MFGYIRPLKDELKVREFEQFKTCYCALCHTLKDDYGAAAQSILNYDFTFLAMLLWPPQDQPVHTCARCVASPFAKKTYCQTTPALHRAAGCSVILAWWKLRDGIRDESFFESLKDRFACLFLRRAYKKAAARFSDFDAAVQSNIDALTALESNGTGSLDQCADKFAQITAAASVESDEQRRRALHELLYHTGRLIYILDAVDDLADDLKAERFNPVAMRYALTSPTPDEETTSALRTTLTHSVNMAGAAFELLDENGWTPITRNIIYLGMPEVIARVLAGTWNKKIETRRQRN